MLTLLSPPRPEAVMSRTADTASCPVELLSRNADGLVVSLHWLPATNGLSVLVLDGREGEVHAVPVEPGQDPLDVFHHPYAYVRAVAA